MKAGTFDGLLLERARFLAREWRDLDPMEADYVFQRRERVHRLMALLLPPEEDDDV